MANRFVLFLDDGGVMSDNKRRAPQWQRLVGEYFAPLLGGTEEAWREANSAYTTVLFDPTAWEERLNASPDFRSFERRYFIDWLTSMCRVVGVPAPPEDEILEISLKASAWIIQRVHAAFPGAADAILKLHSADYELHTASGEASSDLAGYLGGMEVLHCFGTLYGPDLINTLKSGPDYYTRILADAGVPPEEALIVDDSRLALSWAAQVGANTVLVTSTPPEARHRSKGTHITIGSLAELTPDLLAGL